jgi:tetratricopeptide (TPR) repeat protein
MDEHGEPNTAEEFLHRGIEFAEKSNFDAAIEDFSEAIRLAKNFSAYYNRGNAYYDKGDYDKAIDDYTNAIRLDPNDATAHFNRIESYHNKGDSDKAIEDFSEAIRLAKNFSAYYNRGSAYNNKGDYDKAIDDYTNAIRLDPNDDATAYYNRGKSYYNNGDYDKAIDDYTKAIGIDPNNARAYKNCGIAYADKGDYDKAFTDYKKAVEIEPAKNYDQLINKLLKNNITRFWNLDTKKLESSSHFFLRIIGQFKEEGFIDPVYMYLINVVFNFWFSCLLKTDDAVSYIYQYTKLNVLNKMIKTQRMRLTPSSYLNDPFEGKTFYELLDSEEINEIRGKSESEMWTVFVRSMTGLEDSLVMWNSSYGDEAKGAAIGIQVGQFTEIQGGLNAIVSNDNGNTLKQNQKTASDIGIPMPVEMLGLYKVQYLDKDSAGPILKIKECLDTCMQNTNGINVYKQEILLWLFIRLLMSITHLIKRKDFEHEEEYRIMYIGNIEDDKTYIQSAEGEGVFVETEPMLFKNGTDEILLGPNVNEITRRKYEDSFRYKGWNPEMIRKSDIELQ